MGSAPHPTTAPETLRALLNPLRHGAGANKVPNANQAPRPPANPAQTGACPRYAPSHRRGTPAPGHAEGCPLTAIPAQTGACPRHALPHRREPPRCGSPGAVPPNPALKPRLIRKGKPPGRKNGKKTARPHGTTFQTDTPFARASPPGKPVFAKGGKGNPVPRALFKPLPSPRLCYR
jgi:hypothetical protein